MNADYSKWAILLPITVFLVWCARRRLFSSNFLPWAVTIPLVLTGWLGLVSLWQGGGYDVAYQWTRWGGWAAIIAAVFCLSPERRDAVAFSRGLCGFILLMGIVWLCWLAGWTEQEFSNHRGELLLTFSGKNAMGCWLLMALPWLILLFFDGKSGLTWKASSVLAIMFSGGLIWMSLSRSSLILFLVLLILVGGVMWGCMMRAPRYKIWPWWILSATGMLLPIWMLLPDKFRIRFFDLLQGHLPAREFLFSSSWELITRDPTAFLFGHGLGILPAEIFSMPAHVAPQIVRNKADLYSHNLYLDLWMEGGLAAVALFLIFYLSRGARTLFDLPAG
jgi:hypothetical protein